VPLQSRSSSCREIATLRAEQECKSAQRNTSYLTSRTLHGRLETSSRCGGKINIDLSITPWHLQRHPGRQKMCFPRGDSNPGSRVKADNDNHYSTSRLSGETQHGVRGARPAPPSSTSTRSAGSRGRAPSAAPRGARSSPRTRTSPSPTGSHSRATTSVFRVVPPPPPKRTTYRSRHPGSRHAGHLADACVAARLSLRNVWHSQLSARTLYAPSPPPHRAFTTHRSEPCEI
jgi:hypothetical protein